MGGNFRWMPVEIREKVATWATLEIRLPLPFSSPYLEVIGNAREFRGHRVRGIRMAHRHSKMVCTPGNEGHAGNTHPASPSALPLAPLSLVPIQGA